MLLSQARTRVYIYRYPCDMRKGILGLAGLILSVMELDPLSGHCFCFINRNRNQVKVLYWDISGYCLWTKKLTRGRYQQILDQELSPLELLMQLEDNRQSKRRYIFLPK